MAVQVQKRLFTVAEYHKMGEVGIRRNFPVISFPAAPFWRLFLFC
jgi:hypothetical protein